MPDLTRHSERMADTQIPPDGFPVGFVVTNHLSLYLEPAVAMVAPLEAVGTRWLDPNSRMLDLVDSRILGNLAVLAKGDQTNAGTMAGWAVPDSIAEGRRSALAVVATDGSMSTWPKKATVDTTEAGGIAFRYGRGSVDESRSPTTMNLTTLVVRLAAG